MKPTSTAKKVSLLQFHNFASDKEKGSPDIFIKHGKWKKFTEFVKKRDLCKKSRDVFAHF